MTHRTKHRDAPEKPHSTNRKSQKTAPTRQKPGPGAKSARNSGTKRTTKGASMLALLQRKTGASIPELMQASGWQAHSVRGFLSSKVGKREDLTLSSELTDTGRRYRTETIGKGRA